MPGVLPVLNRKVVEYSLQVAVATRCSIQQESRFKQDRLLGDDGNLGTKEVKVNGYMANICVID